MVIQQIGKYEATKNITIRSPFCGSTFRKGGEFTVTQVDFRFHKIYSPEFKVWIYWDIPCKKIESK